MAQTAFLDEGRKYPARFATTRFAPSRLGVENELSVQDVLLAIQPPDQGSRKSAGASVFLVALLHACVVGVFLYQKTHVPAVTQAVPIDIQIASPVPETQPVSPPVPAPASPKQPVKKLSALPTPDRTPVSQDAVPALSEQRPAESNATSDAVAEKPAPARPLPQPVPAVETQATGRMGYLSNPAPVYPESAQDRGLEGTVMLYVRVLANGRAESVEIQHSSGWRILDDAALRTVRNWMFVPATRGGVAVDGWATVPIVFKLGK